MGGGSTGCDRSRRWWIANGTLGTTKKLVMKREHLHAIVGSRTYAHTRPLCVSLLPGRKGRQASTLDTSRQCETAFTSGTVTCMLALRNVHLCIVKKYRPYIFQFHSRADSIIAIFNIRIIKLLFLELLKTLLFIFVETELRLYKIYH